MRIALVVPNYMCSKTFLQPPIELYTAQKIIQQKGHTADVFDFRVLKRSAYEAALDIPANTELIIVSVSPYDMAQMYHMDYRYRYAEHFTRIMKAQHPSAFVFGEGAQCTLKPETFLTHTQADGAILWEIERTLAVLVDAINEKSKLTAVPNLALYQGDETIFYSPFDEDFAHPDIPFIDFIPNWSQVDFSGYFGYDLDARKHEPLDHWGVILASRGCSFHCDFCFNFYKNHLRFRSVKNVATEMAMLSRIGLKRVFFLDMTFTQNRQWVTALCNLLIKQGNTLPWLCQTRCDCVDEELLVLMKEAGCCSIEFGIETFCDESLLHLNKQLTTEQIENALAACRACGITVSAFLMVGTPFESESSIRATIQMLKSCQISFIPIIYTPRLGSPLGNALAEKYSARCWEDFLSLRGKLSPDYALMNMISDHSVLKGESMGTVSTDFNHTKLEHMTAHHRTQFNNASFLETNHTLGDYIIDSDHKHTEEIIPFVSFPIVSACPFSCIYCGQGGENTISPLPTMKLETIMDIAVHLKRAGVRKVRLTGGEPLVHPEIGDIIRFLSESGFYVLVNTNGLLVEDKLDALMRTSSNIHFAVSLDTLDPVKFDKISRTTGNFDKVMRGIQLLKKLGYLMRINMVVGSFNFDEVDDMIAFCRENRCDLKLQEVASVPYPHHEWSSIHADLSQLEVGLTQRAKSVIVHEYARSFGIPVKVFEIDGVMVTLKSMNQGSRYELDGLCKSCPHLPCHEGLYDIYVLADGSIAACRWCRFGSLETFAADLDKAILAFQNASYIGGHQLQNMTRCEELSKEGIQRL